MPPIELESKSNFRFIRDFGSPSRCTQIGALVASGRYICVFPDDCIVESLALQECIEFMDSKSQKDGMTILYSEGPNHSGVQHLDPLYWVARTHADLRLNQIKDEWKIAPNFIYSLEYYISLGGVDCRFEHINMNTHDLAFRVQRNGGTIYSSPRRVIKTDWVPWSEINKTPTQLAYILNDAPLFKKIYDGSEEPLIYIDFNNWKNSDEFWKRRWDTSV